MSFAVFIGTLFEGILGAEAPRVLGWLESKIPGALGEFVKFVMGSQGTQDWLVKLEHEAGSEVTKLVGQGLGALEALCHAHIHGQVGAFIDSKLGELQAAATFTPEEAQQFAVLIASGKWPDVWAAAKKDLGL